MVGAVQNFHLLGVGVALRKKGELTDRKVVVGVTADQQLGRHHLYGSEGVERDRRASHRGHSLYEPPVRCHLQRHPGSERVASDADTAGPNAVVERQECDCRGGVIDLTGSSVVGALIVARASEVETKRGDSSLRESACHRNDYWAVHVATALRMVVAYDDAGPASRVVRQVEDSLEAEVPALKANLAFRNRHPDLRSRWAVVQSPIAAILGDPMVFDKEGC